ncbi:MAG: M3 family metallopeptidase [Elusimicrobiota bacterium]|jgi:thimet oligopeptidase
MPTPLRLSIALLILLAGAPRAQIVVPALPLPVGGAAAGAAAQGAVGAALAPQVPDFSLSTRRMAETYKAAERDYLAAVNAVTAIPAAERTFANTVKALDSAQARYAEAAIPLTFLSAVSPDRRVRRMAEAIERRIGRFGLDLADRDDLYTAYKEYAAKGEALSGEDKMILEDTLESYKRSGKDLPVAQRSDLRAIRERMAELEQAFEQNIAAEDDALAVEPGRLTGLPQDLLDALPRDAQGRAVVDLKEPSYVPFMRYVRDGELRRQLYYKYQNRAAEKNLPLLEEELALRGKLAKILGYRTYAHLALADNMAESPLKVVSFLNRLKRGLRPAVQEERKALLEQKRREVPDAARVEPWETAYYADKLRQERYAFDADQVRQYFPVDRVVAGTLEVYQELLGVRFRQLPNQTPAAGPGAAGAVRAENGTRTAWHPDVQLYEISDAKSGEVLSYFYLDLFPREGKYTHAAAFGVISGHELEDGGYRRPIEAMVANLSKPTPGHPALLTLMDVETFFHEFGHLMHGTLTKARYRDHAGTSVALDFVEAPSQMMENFVWRPEVLERLSGHWRDPDKKLPKELLEKMLAARNFQSATGNLSQVGFAMMDMLFNLLPGPVDTTAVMAKVFTTLGLEPPPPGTHFQASFGHLMSGYGAGYYSYLWSLVFAQDLFSRFEAEGVLNPATGGAYRRAILEKGSSRDENASMKEFLGREPNERAFMRFLGLGKAEKTSAGEVQVEKKLPPEFFDPITAALTEEKERVRALMDKGLRLSIERGSNPRIPVVLFSMGPYRTMFYLWEAQGALREVRFKWYKPSSWFSPRSPDPYRMDPAVQVRVLLDLAEALSAKLAAPATT